MCIESSYFLYIILDSIAACEPLPILESAGSDNVNYFSQHLICALLNRPLCAKKETVELNQNAPHQRGFLLLSSAQAV